ncbi:FecR family protein [Salmonirosea aquatica]|uniref:DUF4974 domain-containing protein n=1 Tax=Salmonirosea aquatica TaxID=2654236 RepID=A0A7C9F5C2_9BACT|nr:DUF4974 domain-containing protein [Cytophagaceae bacterium SJW1-29]
MKNYEQYSVEDFIQDESFRDWVQGHGQQETFWLSFLQKYPNTSEAFHQAERFIRATSVAAEPLGEREIRTEVQRFLERATGSAAAFPEQVPPAIRTGIFRSSRFRQFAAIAALVVIGLSLSWYYTDLTPKKQTAEIPRPPDRLVAQLVETNNPSDEPLRLLLSDNSEVILGPQSQLRYPSRFSDTERVVYLSGEASFQVNRQNRPFKVHTGEMVTKVLGTHFVVSAYERNQKMTVQVLSGKVSVYRSEPNRAAESRERNGVILTANQAAIFEKKLHHLSKTLVANPVPLNRKVLPMDIRYDEVPLSDILHQLENSYGITIQFDEQNFKPCQITATLSNETLYEKLDLLCKTVSASYEIVDGQIVLSGEGCR